MKNKLIGAFVALLLSTSSFAQVLNIVSFGAKEGSNLNNAKAIQNAIDKCAQKGGIVLVPPGKYYSGTIYLKSNVTLSVMKGAELVGSPFLKDYPVNTVSAKTRPPHRPQWPSMPSRALIYADGQSHISITGEGTINGNGLSKEFKTRDDDPNRPKMIMFVACKDVNVRDIHLRNSAFWLQHYFACDGVRITGVNVYNHGNLNNDGIDIDSKNVIISDCNIDSDDDAICMKSDGFDLVENVSITNCVVASNCNLIKMGTASYAGFKNVSVSNCVLKKASVSIMGKKNRHNISVEDSISAEAGIALEAVDGGSINQVVISNITMTGIQTPIFIKLGNRKFQPAPVSNIIISNVTATSTSFLPSSITGIPGNDVNNVILRDIMLISKGGGKNLDPAKPIPENSGGYPGNSMFGKTLPAYGLFLRHINGIELNNVKFFLQSPDERTAIYQSDVKNFKSN
ncbi:glycoside hydrolase family 28 protein [Pedobacter miscanthi]|uniref:glycoside hydrolase family 28 protein n=1 Tax=Pedobacter miscanthi TaxID=2259170 RepID=UPI00292E314C|nr:glycosyl hydrolase family 28 protein [Pedobacter miscanthi]